MLDDSLQSNIGDLKDTGTVCWDEKKIDVGILVKEKGTERLPNVNRVAIDH